MPQPRKQFGQHWLRSEKALSKIVAAAELRSAGGEQGQGSQGEQSGDADLRASLEEGQDNPKANGDRVLEIGPGLGVLTRQLVEQAESVVAVEIDHDLCALLAPKMGKIDNFLLLQSDFLAVDLATLLTPFPKFQNPNKVVANIPYNITGPILEKLLGTIANPNPKPYELIVLLVQREVALRLKANPGSTHFGALSVRVQYLANCELICDVPASAFQPPPKVDSAVIRLRPKAIATPAENPQRLETLLKLGFSSKRKMLRNNLQGTLDRDQLGQFLEEIGSSSQARAEELSVEQWVKLSNYPF